VDAAEAVRERLQRDVPIRNLWVIPKKDIDNALTNSGYPTDEALNAADSRQLAVQFRADEYVTGQIAKQPDGKYKVDARLILARDASLVQPLSSVVVSKPSDAGSQLSKEIQAARKQLDGEKECLTLARQKQFDQAIAKAEEGIKEYPRATLARICKANAMAEAKRSPDEILAITKEILDIDPRSRPALRLAYQAHTEKGAKDLATQTLIELLRADPSNVQLQNQVLNQLAQDKQWDKAIPIMQQALQENPGDPDLLRTSFLINLAAERWKDAAKLGEELAQMDTSATDSTYFVRLATAYVQDSQPQKAAEVISRGTAKYPKSAGILLSAAQMYRSAGQLQQAKDALTKALALDPKAENANVQLAQIYADANQPDSAIVALDRAKAAGDTLAGPFALSLANTTFKAANAANPKNRDQALAAKRYAEFAYQQKASPEAAFLIGAPAFLVLSTAASEAQQQKSCELARLAGAQVPAVTRYMPEGGRLSPEFAQQAMGFVQQYGPAIEGMSKTYCR
jgi:tetratricopeptide (TPR) repeat protein